MPISKFDETITHYYEQLKGRDGMLDLLAFLPLALHEFKKCLLFVDVGMTLSLL